MDRLLSFRLSALGLFRLLFSRPLSHVFGQRFCVRYGGLCGFGGWGGGYCGAWDPGGVEKGLERG